MAKKGDIIFVRRKLPFAIQLDIIKAFNARLMSKPTCGRATQIIAFLFTFVLAWNLARYKHYGIYVGNEEVIHFTGSISPLEGPINIRQTSLKDFLDKGKLEVDESYVLIFDAVDVIKRAKEYIAKDESCCKFGKYNLFFNNCEHFAVWCSTDKKYSKQTKYLRNLEWIIGKEYSTV